MDIYLWIGTAFTAIVSIVGIYLKGRSDGRSRIEKSVTEERLATQKHATEVLQKAKTVSESVASADSNDVSKRLRDKWSRD